MRRIQNIRCFTAQLQLMTKLIDRLVLAMQVGMLLIRARTALEFSMHCIRDVPKIPLTLFQIQSASMVIPNLE